MSDHEISRMERFFVTFMSTKTEWFSLHIRLAKLFGVKVPIEREGGTPPSFLKWSFSYCWGAEVVSHVDLATVLEYFSWVTRLWLLLDNALEHSTKSKHIYPMGSASKMEITFYTEFILSPGFSKKSGLSRRWFIQTRQYLPVLERLVRMI